MTRTRLHRAIALALLFPAVLAGCGGGSAGTSQLRAPAIQLPSSPASAPSSLGPCPSPVTGTCTVTAPGTLFGGRQSTGAFVLDMPDPDIRAEPPVLHVGNADLRIGTAWRESTYDFAGGTDIRSGVLSISLGNTWRSDVRVGRGGIRPATLYLDGTLLGNVQNAGYLSTYNTGVLRGTVDNQGLFHQSGTVEGNVTNRGDLVLHGGLVTGNVVNSGAFSNELTRGRDGDVQIRGNYTQTGEGVLWVRLAPAGMLEYERTLRIGGSATLAGTLAFHMYDDGWGPYDIPGVGSRLILHAAGGIAGAFDHWEAPGLFLTGSLRYEPNEVWFDLTRVSATAAMAASAQATSLTLVSAANVDRALSMAAGFAQAPTMAQQGFLSSAGKLLWMQDTAQAVRALDTLSGLPQAQAVQAAFAAATPPALAARLDARVPGQAAGGWSLAGAGGVLAGADAWLGPRLLAGAHASQTADTGGAPLDAAAAHRGAGAGMYMRWFGDGGWYVGAQAGYASHSVALQRPIDFGEAGRWSARSQRRFDVATLAGEAGRGIALGAARLTPFLRLEAGALQADAAIEQGQSGFELALAPLRQQRLQAGAGLRYARDWRVGMHRARLDASMGATHALLHAGGAQRAAFTGVPDAGFALPWRDRDARWFDLGLEGDAGRWQWAVHGARLTDAGAAWRLQLVRPL